MASLFPYLVVFVTAATPWLEVLLVVPAGIVAGLPPVPVTFVAALGNAATLLPLVYAGDRVRGWWRRRRNETAAEPDREPTGDGRGGRARRLFDRYGLPGLAALGPLLTGVHVAALVALAAGADRRRTALWLTLGLTLWAVIAAAATVAGLDAFVDADRLPDLFGQAESRSTTWSTQAV